MVERDQRGSTSCIPHLRRDGGRLSSNFSTHAQAEEHRQKSAGQSPMTVRHSDLYVPHWQHVIHKGKAVVYNVP
jgi:hypothetical protein